MVHTDSLVDKPRYGKEQNQSCSLLKIFDSKALALLLFTMFFLLAPLDTAEVVMALAGGVVYALLKVLPKVASSKKCQASKRPLKGPQHKDVLQHKDVCAAPGRSDRTPSGAGSCAVAPQPSVHPAPTAVAPAARSVSKTPKFKVPAPPSKQKCSATAVPIAVPVFKVADFNSQVNELVSQLMPTSESEKIVAEIARHVKQAVQPLFPDVDVCGFACGSLGTSAAYGVAVPEIDIVASANAAEILKRLHGLPTWLGTSKRGMCSRDSPMDSVKLQKSAIRECTSLLMRAGFKFRRSWFRSCTPKVTVMVPPTLGICSESVPCDFSVNNTTPFCNMALFTECGLIEPRAKELILLVKRWIKDRGICHAAKGHLPPYAWSLLVIYFLQVGVFDEGPLLPPLEDFVVVSGLMAKRQRGSMPVPKVRSAKAPVERAHSNSVGDLFKKFVYFYTEKMKWHKEAVSVRLGKRASPNSDLQIHSVVNDGTRMVSPIIEDPFNAKKNLGSCTTTWTLMRFHEEFARARALIARDEPLSVLLELWRPPEADGKDFGEDVQQDGLDN